MERLPHFTKHYMVEADLVALLESRGLIISDEAKAVRYLENIGYYRLSAYMYPFLKVPKESHQYKDSTTFQKVLNLYRFDKKLRMLLLNEIEKIEIAIRRAIMNIPYRWYSLYLEKFFGWQSEPNLSANKYLLSSAQEYS